MSRIPTPDSASRRQIARDLLVFQVKLWIEGFKDIVLVPLSLGAAVIDLILGRAGRRGSLHALMRTGVRFERWINLYGTLDDNGGVPPPVPPERTELVSPPSRHQDAVRAEAEGEGTSVRR